MIHSGRYTRVAILLHWLVAAMITVNVLMIWAVDSLPDSMERPIIDTHKSIGITVLGLAILRLLWRLTHPAPPFPASYRRWERLAAHAAHIVLYVLIFCLPLSGWIHDSAWKGAAAHPLTLYGIIPWFRIGAIAHQDPDTKEAIHSLFSQIHTSLAYVLYAMVVLHIAGALKHQFIDRQPELQRMLPGGPLP